MKNFMVFVNVKRHKIHDVLPFVIKANDFEEAEHIFDKMQVVHDFLGKIDHKSLNVNICEVGDLHYISSEDYPD